MDQIRGAMVSAIGETLGELLGSAIGVVIVALLMLVGALPLYFLLKKVTRSQTTFAEDLRESFDARPQPRPETLGMLSTLDSVESVLLQIYKYLLIVVLVLASVFIVWFFIGVQNDAHRSFLRLYFGIAYLFLVCWVAGSFAVIKRRKARGARPIHRSSGIDFQVRHTAETVALDETSLDAARMYLAAGETLESVCGYIHPKYKQWHPSQRQVFEMALSSALAHAPGRAAAAASGSTAPMNQSEDPSPARPIRASVQPAPAPAVGTAPPQEATRKARGLTTQQVLVVAVVFVLAVATFSVILLMMRGLPELRVPR